VPETPEAQDALVGSILDGKYRIDKLIGVGGMGKVYKGLNIRTESPVAIKTLIPDLVRDDALVMRFEIEAKAASNLRHPNTIRIYDFGRDGDRLFMVMELLDGIALEDLTRDHHPIEPRRVIHIMRQTCQSLAEAHASGLVHRDLKPDNIFLNRVGDDTEFVKVLDFGVAKLRDKRYGNTTLTQAGMIFGTPRYMSPEQARAQDIDQRSDIYALGVIMYECLTGYVPFDARDPIAILVKHVNEPPRPFSEVNQYIQALPDLEAVVMRCLEKEASDRYSSVKELLEDLERVDRRLATGTTGVISAQGNETQALIPSGGSSIPMTRPNTPSTQRSTPVAHGAGANPFDALGIAEGDRDETIAIGDRTLQVSDGPPIARRVPVVPIAIVTVFVVLGLVGTILYKTVLGGGAGSEVGTEVAGAVAAAVDPEGEATDGDPAQTSGDGLEQEGGGEVDEAMQAAAAQREARDAVTTQAGVRVSEASEMARALALRHVATIRFTSAHEGLEISMTDPRDPESVVVVPELIHLVRDPVDADAADGEMPELDVVFTAAGHRPLPMSLALAESDQTVHIQLSRQRSGGSTTRTDGTSSSGTTTATPPPGLDDPYR